jgi:hypothetical protein
VALVVTLILTMANRAYVLQVADRLVTRDVGKPRREPVDPLANKCVIYVATDALIAISYTGVAFMLGNPPTSGWPRRWTRTLPAVHASPSERAGGLNVESCWARPSIEWPTSSRRT